MNNNNDAIAKSPKQWCGSVFTAFNDGDIVDYIDITSLQNHHDCTQDEPEWSLAWGGRFQSSEKTDFVGLGLNRDSGGISLELSNHIDAVLGATKLKSSFTWYITWNTKTNESIIHYSDEGSVGQEIANMKWREVREWIANNQFLIYVHEYREKVVPIWFNE